MDLDTNCKNSYMNLLNHNFNILSTRAILSYSLTHFFDLFPSLETEGMSHTIKKEFTFLSNQIKYPQLS